MKGRKKKLGYNLQIYYKQEQNFNDFLYILKLMVLRI